ncbi:MAG TPA: CBS domain-containing protein, partial [Anaerolinea sp.]|nr:CBS domain-containing protein [Anaerolinea sp.]
DEVMHPNPVTVPANMPIDLLGSEFLRTGRHGFPVVSPDRSLFGVVSLEDYRRATSVDQPKQKDLTVGDIATQSLITVTPEDSVGAAMRRMAPRDLSRLPVVNRDNPRVLLGVVRRNDIVRAYEVGVVRREEARRRAEAISGVSDLRSRFVDIMVAHNADAAGKKVADLSLPRAAVLVSIRRGKELVIPHGDTVLEEGDIVTALVEQNSERNLRDAFV